MTTSSQDHAPNTCAALDISKIKPGDEVLARGIVAEVFKSPDPLSAGLRLHMYRLDGSHHDPYVPLCAIVSHTPKALAVGDRVQRTTAQRPYPFDILAIDKSGRVAACQGDGDDMFMCPVCDLERVS